MLNKSSRRSSRRKPVVLTRTSKHKSGAPNQINAERYVKLETLPALPEIPASLHQISQLNQAIAKQEQLNEYLLAVAGVTKEDLQHVVTQLREALQATETKFFAHEGRVKTRIDVINWRARLEALEKWMKLFKLIGGADRKLPSGSDVLKVEVDLAPGLKRARGLA